MASNENWVINVEGGDRRYLVLDVDAGPRNNDREYFGDLARRWDEGEREAFFAMLATRNLSNWDEGAIPETAAKTDQRELSLGDEEAWVQEILEGGELPSVGWFTDDSAFVASAELPFSSKRMGAAMRLTGAQGMTRKKRRGWWIPSLGTARARFAEATGLRPDWQDHPHAAWGHVRGRAGTDSVDLGASQEDIPF